jgi:hypothetical protein
MKATMNGQRHTKNLPYAHVDQLSIVQIAHFLFCDAVSQVVQL